MGKIHVGLIGAREMIDLRLARNSHDFQIVGIRAEPTLAKSLAYRILAGPEPVCGRFCHDCHVSTGPILHVRKVATLHDRDAEQLKIARRNVVEFGRMAAFLPGDRKKAAVVSVTERGRPGLSHGVHTGKGREPIYELPLEDLGLLIAVTGTAEVEGSHGDVFYFKARLAELRPV